MPTGAPSQASTLLAFGTERRFKGLLAVLTIMLLAHASVESARAQDARPRIKIVAHIHGDAEKCGVSKQAAEAETARVLRNNGILTTPQSDPWMYVDIFAMTYGANTCFVVAKAELNASGSIRQAGPFQLRPGAPGVSISLCSTNWAGVWPISQTTGKVDFESLIGRCIGDLEY